MNFQIRGKQYNVAREDVSECRAKHYTRNG